MCENKVLLRSKEGILIGVFYVFLPKIGAISAFLTTIWVEMMMIGRQIPLLWEINKLSYDDDNTERIMELQKKLHQLL